MENLGNKTDAQLISELKANRGSEVESVIYCFRRLNEVATRGTDLDRGYPSMTEFAREELKYSKDEAYPRVRAAELFALDPIIETYFREYKISVTSLFVTQVTFLREAKRRKLAKLPLLSVSERVEVVAKIANESVKGTKRVLAEVFPELQKDCEETKPLKDGRTLITHGASPELLAMYERIKDLTAHSNYDRKWEAFFEMLANAWLKHNDPVLKKERRSTRAENKPAAAPVVEEQIEFEVEIPGVPKRWERTLISAKTQRANFERAGNSCQFVDPETGRRCCSRHGLESDHIIPPHRGGTNDLDNLRVYCRAHNSHAARRMGLKQKKRQADGSVKFRYPAFRNERAKPVPSWN